MILRIISKLPIFLFLFTASCATESMNNRDIASTNESPLYDVSFTYDIDLYKAKVDLSKAKSFEDNLSELEYIVVSPVEYNKQEVLPNSAPFICSSLGYTFLAGVSLKECSHFGASLVSATTQQLQNAGMGTLHLGSGTAVSFVPSAKCYAPSSTGFTEKPKLGILKAVRCGRIKN